MDVIIKIKGRQAIPVRALPWMTHDRHLSAQDVADALSLSSNFPDFAGVHPFRLDGGIVDVDYWRDKVQGKIKQMEKTMLEPEQWRFESLAALPAGVLVWRDEWESAYNASPYGPDCLAALGDAADRQEIAERTLNFAPHIKPELVQLVMDGFTVVTDKTGATMKKVTGVGTNARRYQMCIDAGLPMPDNDYATLPAGIGDLAKQEEITKQAFSKSVKKHMATIRR